MSKLFLKYLLNILTIYLMSFLFHSIHIGNAASLLVMGLILLIVNLIVRPLMLLITLPLNLLTLGLFTFIVNAWALMIADFFVPGIYLGGFLNSLFIAFVIVLTNHFLRKRANKQ